MPKTHIFLIAIVAFAFIFSVSFGIMCTGLYAINFLDFQVSLKATDFLYDCGAIAILSGLGLAVAICLVRSNMEGIEDF